MKKSVRVFLILLVGLLLFGSGCAVNNEEKNTSKGKIELIISENFGDKEIFHREVDYKKNISVMDILLDSGLNIETGYGGGYITGIDGLTVGTGGMSGVRKDWFYYVNGIFADVGGLDYYPEPGEVIWWDYHPWKMAMGGSMAVVGCFPEPFLHGYRGEKKQTIIMCNSGEKELGLKLKESLLSYGISEIEVQEIDEKMLKNREDPTIILGVWEKLQDVDWMKKLNANSKKNGTSIYFTNDALEILDFKGEVADRLLESAGVICATAEGSGDDSPLWIISGTNQEGLKKAVDIIVNHPEKISGMFTAIVHSEKVIRLPLLGD